MCGIAGYFSFSEKIEDGIKVHFSKALSHRGPDGEGIYTTVTHSGERIFLLHRRLSINDIEQGAQPLLGESSSGKETALIVNGEIYNTLELRSSYAEYPFKTHSDSESLLPLYFAKGKDFLSNIQGMYALALYDGDQEKLILARDPLGIKPLYYKMGDKGFAFASEIEALIYPWEEMPPLEKDAQGQVLNLQFSCGRNTLFSGIYRLLPGESLEISRGRLQHIHRQNVLDYQEKRQKLTSTEALKRFEDIFLETLEAHLMSDVPLGIFYSKGLDSSVLLQGLNLLGHKNLPAFYMRFKEEENISSSFPLKASFEEVEFQEKDFWRLLPLGAYVMDDLALDYALLPTLKLAEKAKASSLRVILSGEGGDEVFAGYGRYKKVARPWILGGRSLREKSLLQGLDLLRESSPWRKEIEQTEKKLSLFKNLSPLQRAQALDMEDWLPHDLMMKLDRTLMYFGIEGRPPFLDKSLVKFGFFLPDSLKIFKGEGKWILKEWMRLQTPTLNFFTKKQGFTPPVGLWIAQKAQVLGELLKKQTALTSLCYPEKIEGLFKHLAQDPSLKKEGMAAWILLFYTIWYKIHVEKVPHEEDTFTLLENR